MSEQHYAIDLEVVEETKSVIGDKFPVMVEYFLEDARTYMSSIKEGIATNDAEKICDPAHTIKSSSRQLGAMVLANHAEEIELICRNILDGSGGDIESIKNLYEQMENTFTKAESELKKLI